MTSSNPSDSPANDSQPATNQECALTLSLSASTEMELDSMTVVDDCDAVTASSPSSPPATHTTASTAPSSTVPATGNASSPPPRAPVKSEQFGTVERVLVESISAGSEGNTANNKVDSGATYTATAVSGGANRVKYNGPPPPQGYPYQGSAHPYHPLYNNGYHHHAAAYNHHHHVHWQQHQQQQNGTANGGGHQPPSTTSAPPPHHHPQWQGGRHRYPGHNYHPPPNAVQSGGSTSGPQGGAGGSVPAATAFSSGGVTKEEDKNTASGGVAGTVRKKETESSSSSSNNTDKKDGDTGTEKEDEKDANKNNGSAIPNSSSWSSHGTNPPPHPSYPHHPHHHHPHHHRAYGNWPRPPPNLAGYAPHPGQYQNGYPHPPYPGYNHPYHGIPPQQQQQQQGLHHHHPHAHHGGIMWSNSNASTATAGTNAADKNKNMSMNVGGGGSVASDGNKKRLRDDKEERDDVEDKEKGGEKELRRNYSEDTASTMSIGGFSMTSLGRSVYGNDRAVKASSPKRRKGPVRNQNIHRTFSSELKDGHLPLLENSSTLSDGKMILQNLSLNSLGSLNQTYSAEIAELCGPSPINKTYKAGAGGSAFRLDLASATPATMRMSSQEDDDSPTMIDLIGGAETPMTGLLLSSMDNIMTDESSLNRHLRGHTFTPLPHILGADDGLMMSAGGNFAITPQLSWSINGSPLGSSGEKMTPRFGLDSTKSRKNPLASPKSFWKDDFLDDKGNDVRSKTKKNSEKSKSEINSILSMLSPTMRDMDVNDPSMDGRSTSPIPIHSPWGAGRPAYMSSPIPAHHHHGQPMMSSPCDGRFGAQHRRDGPPPPYGMYPPAHHHMAHQYEGDRVRNLRGRGPPTHHMPPQHHLPPPSYHHFSPLTNVQAVQRGRVWHQNQMPHHLDLSASKRKCVPIKPPIPSKFQGDIQKYRDAQVPEFNNLVNFPGHMSQKQAPNIPEGMRCCVMCGQACPCSSSNKQKKSDKSGPGSGVAPLGNNNSNKSVSSANTGSGFAIIPTQNKGLCTLCDVNVWIVTQSGLEIKWCKGCKNFRPWAAFGDKGLATKCMRCRDRQREKYAMQKEEKERLRIGAASARTMVGSQPS
eukprot:g4748.t1 g4748   contig16:224284-228296(+)